MLDTFDYTKEFVVSSSLIDSVHFNENDGTVVLDVNDELYRYSGVNGQDVSALVRADSVGAHYNKVFKPTFGPAEHLGYWDDLEPNLVPVEKDQSVPTTPKGLYLVDGSEAPEVDAPTKEYSLSVFDNTVSGAPLRVVEGSDEEPTKEYSLSFEDEAPEVSAAEGIEGVREIVVHFTLDSFDRKFKFTAEGATSVEGAIEELNDYVSKMRATGRVRKVVVKFD